jgi:hypothetical protein
MRDPEQVRVVVAVARRPDWANMFGVTGTGVGTQAGAMSAVPGNLDTERQPPMSVPLCHFLVALGFLLAGALLGLADLLGVETATLAVVHLLLVGWVCVTIMGAMTQFVPVWSGVELHSRRLATWQLPLVGGGLLGFVGCLLAGRLTWTPVFAVPMLAGFWLFVYNVAHTLLAAGAPDATERRFALALGFFVLVTLLGVLLATDFATGVLAVLGAPRSNVVAAHATLAVFGAVLVTVVGALYQLGTMFTQTSLRRFGRTVRRIEGVTLPGGVLALAGGRLVASRPLAAIGGLLVALSLAGVAAVLARKLLEMRVDWTPMHRRYAVAVAALLCWAVVTVPAWLTAPLGGAVLLGAAGTGRLLLAGAVGFVVLGTLYHVVPFVVWVHRYSDRIGYEPVPMVDDLYDGRLAALDFSLTVAGAGAFVALAVLPLPAFVGAGGGVLLTAGVVVFVANVVLVVRRHSPHTLVALVCGPGTAWPAVTDSTEEEAGD